MTKNAGRSERKLLIEESVLRQWLEVLRTWSDASAHERGRKAIGEMCETLDAAENVEMLERELAATQHVVAQFSEGERKLRAELVKTRLEASLDYNTLFGELQVALEELAALRKQIDELEPVAYFDDDTSTLTFNKTIPGHAWKPVYLLEGIKK